MDDNFYMDAVKRSTEVARLVAEKNADYGTTNITNCPLGVELGLAIRLGDKLARLYHLADGNEPNYETLRDTALDLMGYSLLLLMHIDGVLPANKKGNKNGTPHTTL